MRFFTSCGGSGMTIHDVIPRSVLCDEESLKRNQLMAMAHEILHLLRGFGMTIHVVIPMSVRCEEESLKRMQFMGVAQGNPHPLGLY
jgi:hypothetical protein